MNEEKEPRFFVWERSLRGLAPAIYRGMPRTVSGDAADKDRFVQINPLKPDEMDMNIDELKERYPAP